MASTETPNRYLLLGRDQAGVRLTCLVALCWHFHPFLITFPSLSYGSYIRLSDAVSYHSVSHHMFADNTELYKSDSPSEAFTLARTIESCISDVKVWVVQDKLQLNDDKTEIFLKGSVPEIDLPSSLCVGHSDIPFSSAVRNLGVIFDSQLALKEQVNKLSTCIHGDQADGFSPTVSFF